MHKKEHAALANFLLSFSNNEELLKHKKAFFIGCVGPDYNPLTYTRGSIRNKLLHGHHAPNSKSLIMKCLKKLPHKETRSFLWYFKLGTLMHYVADSFTYPHNSFYDGTLLDHRVYERDMHEIFAKKTDSYESKKASVDLSNIVHFFKEHHLMYSKGNHSIENDCEYILKVTLEILGHLAPSKHVKIAYDL